MTFLLHALRITRLVTFVEHFAITKRSSLVSRLSHLGAVRGAACRIRRRTILRGRHAERRCYATAPYCPVHLCPVDHARRGWHVSTGYLRQTGTDQDQRQIAEPVKHLARGRVSHCGGLRAWSWRATGLGRCA